MSKNKFCDYLFNRNSNGPKVSINSNNQKIQDSEVTKLFSIAEHLWKDVHSRLDSDDDEQLTDIVDEVEQKDHRSMALVMQMMFNNSDRSEINVPVRHNINGQINTTKSKIKLGFNLNENLSNPNLQATDMPTYINSLVTENPSKIPK